MFITYLPQANSLPISVMKTVASKPQRTSTAVSSILSPRLRRVISVGRQLFNQKMKIKIYNLILIPIGIRTSP